MQAAIFYFYIFVCALNLCFSSSLSCENVVSIVCIGSVITPLKLLLSTLYLVVIVRTLYIVRNFFPVMDLFWF